MRALPEFFCVYICFSLLIAGCKKKGPNLDSIIVENRSVNSEVAFADRLYIIAPESLSFFFTPEDLNNFKQIDQFIFTPKIGNTLHGRMVLILKGAKLTQVQQLTQEGLVYVFLEQPSTEILSEIGKMKIKRAIFCIGPVPTKLNKPLSKRILIVPTKMLRDVINLPTEGPASIFFFSNRRKFIG